MFNRFRNQNRLILIPALVVTILVGVGCEYVVTKAGGSPSEEKLAEVGNYSLYASDIKGIDFSGSDSAEVMEKYINDWTRRQSLLLTAEKNLDLEQLEIERKVDNFRYELIVYEYKKRYLEQNLNRDISDDEIAGYYENNKADFELKQNIIKCHYLKFPLDVPKMNKVKRWFYSDDEESYEKLRDFAATHAISYSFEDSTWVKFDEVAMNTPLMSVPNKTNYLRRNSHVVTSDSSHIYFFKINDYKLSNDISPLEFVKENIKNIILNQRRQKLIEELEKNIYKEAKQENVIKVY